jgi:hypothetical protein
MGSLLHIAYRDRKNGNARLTPERDRTGGLRIFGGILIAAGLLFAGMSFLVLAGRFVAARQTGEPVTLYLLISALLITLGIGSVRGRRWAWALTLVTSAFTVAFGLIGAPFIVWMVSRLLSAVPSLSEEASGGVVLAPLIFILFLMILVPVAFLLFYARRDVRATVERLDPEPGWTDRQPLPVIAAAALFAAAAAGWLPALWTPVIPVPGAMLTGNTARALVLAGVLACLAIAWGLSRGTRGAWIAALLFSIGGTALWLWTLRDLDLPALQRALGGSEEELALLRRIDARPGLIVVTLAAAAAWIGFLVWVRRFLARRPLRQ